MKLKLNECTCTRTGRKYCRTSKGYRFVSGKCADFGEKIRVGK